jgi:hypothetical protein
VPLAVGFVAPYSDVRPWFDNLIDTGSVTGMHAFSSTRAIGRRPAATLFAHRRTYELYVHLLPSGRTRSTSFWHELRSLHQFSEGAGGAPAPHSRSRSVLGMPQRGHKFVCVDHRAINGMACRERTHAIPEPGTCLFCEGSNTWATSQHSS